RTWKDEITGKVRHYSGTAHSLEAAQKAIARARQYHDMPELAEHKENRRKLATWTISGLRDYFIGDPKSLPRMGHPLYRFNRPKSWMNEEAALDRFVTNEKWLSEVSLLDLTTKDFQRYVANRRAKGDKGSYIRREMVPVKRLFKLLRKEQM